MAYLTTLLSLWCETLSTTHQNWALRHPIATESVLFKFVSDFGAKMLSKNHHVTHCTPQNGKKLHFCGCFKSMILIIKIYTVKHSIGNISTSHIFNTKFYKASVFKSTFQTRVRCWIEHFTTCQVFSRLLLQFAIFSCVHQTRARFDTALKCGVSSVSQDILLG